jgi:hypothetical protein
MGVTLHIPTGAVTRQILSATSLRWMGGAPPVAAREEIERRSMPKRKRRAGKPQLARLAKSEGVEVKLALDGTVTMTPIKPVDITLIDDDTSGNEWDSVLQ